MVAIGVLLFEFFTLPQVYYFNHVWGSWPGPIYDEEVRITAGLIWFRLTTLLWVLILWQLPSIGSSKKSLVFTSIFGVLLILSFFFQPQLGISTPRSALKSTLGEPFQTEHFQLYYDRTAFNQEEIEYWAARHEFHFLQITEILDVDWPEGRLIESYLYANAWQKKELVGAKFTSYVPVWLEQDQLHIAKEHLEGVLKHELVHVITKQFGNELLNASWSIGLVEGVAEAIARDASRVSTLDQIIAAETPLPTSSEMASALSISGFYASASSISYTTAGSFVSYLLENYPVASFKQAFPGSDFEAAYQLPFDTLVTRWKAQLPVEEVDSVDAQISQFIFSQQSLFQINCPRKIHPVIQGLDKLRYYESKEDSSSAFEAIKKVYAEYPELPLLKQLWASYQLRNQNPDTVLNNINSSDSTLALQLMKADAFFITNQLDSASSILLPLQSNSDFQNDENTQNSFEVRSDSSSWATFTNARYQNRLSTLEAFESSPEPLQWLLVDRAIVLQNSSFLIQYAEIMLQKSPNLTWFDTQESMISMLVYYGEIETARNWIALLRSIELRERFIERVNEQEEWLFFLESY